MATLTFWGFGHLIGQTVSAFIGGLDCGDYVVAANGSIAVPTGSDPDGLLTESYLATLDGDYGETGANITLNGFDVPVTVEIPVVVGLPYTTRGKILRPATSEDLRSPQGPGHGKTRRVHQAAFVVHNTVDGYIGTDFTHLYKLRLTDASGVDLPGNIMFSGVAWQAIDDNPSFDGAICWQQARPLPMTVSAITGFMDTEDR